MDAIAKLPDYKQSDIIEHCFFNLFGSISNTSNNKWVMQLEFRWSGVSHCVYMHGNVILLFRIHSLVLHCMLGMWCAVLGILPKHFTSTKEPKRQKEQITKSFTLYRKSQVYNTSWNSMEYRKNVTKTKDIEDTIIQASLFMTARVF